MPETARWIPICCIAVTLNLAGCGGGHDHDGDDHDHDAATASADDDHGHDHDDDHDAAGTPADDDHGHDHDADDDAHDGDAGHVLGTVEIEGVVLEVTLLEPLEPGREAHLDILHVSGPSPTSVRLWIGDEAGTGAMRSRAEEEGEHFHGHVEAPAEIGQGDALWLEVELPDGARHRGSVGLE